ncbi:MAG: hypothetical protein R6X02_09065 [Enhygromyxa sp.]
MFPQLLQDSLAAGIWLDPGPEILKKLLDLDNAESNLELFESRHAMEQIGTTLDSSGYVDDPEFCMVRSSAARVGVADPRLVYTDAVFVGGSRVPGDDVFLAIDVSQPEREQSILWFDWSRTPPGRWIPLMRLAVFLERLKELRQYPNG